ncbi:hypothetical protein O7606_13190 [Micromonospora sp. WMMD882]|uniref:hypothetical protein n=1 Tax=Micromonospora sp. WMMD882 TaxID=3015151 RepID=UPI00248AE254|nr:hypothetical protein [Micromonospora sp. WMMD882]WBB77257.1 hypothetical protein O7606_13190 [Micromonospora sp. WMMD882]
MSQPTSETRPAGNLVWAPADVIAGLEQQVQPQVSPVGRSVRAALTAFVFTGLPAFVVFAVSTVVAPSVTSGAGIGRTALWAALFAALVAITAAVPALRSRADGPDSSGADPSGWRVALRLAFHALVTGGCAALALATQGLSVGQVAPLAGTLVVVLHVLPLTAARLLRHPDSPRRSRADCR